MTTAPIDPSAVRAELRKVAEQALADRLAHIDTITDARAARTAAAERVAAARADEAAAARAEEAAFRAAVHGGGWSATELRRAGLTVPDSIARPGTRRPGRTTTAPKRTTAPAPAVSNTDPAIDGDAEPTVTNTDTHGGSASAEVTA